MGRAFLTVVGHVNEDVILGTDFLPRFGSVEVKSFSNHLGGTGANIALVASRLGVPVTLISRISRSFPSHLLEPLNHENIELILERENTEGPVCYIVDSRKEQVAFMFQGPMNTPGKVYDIESKYCHFATSNPAWILMLMERCRGKKVFDPGQEISYRWSREDLGKAFAMSDLIILNKNESDFAGSLIPEGKDIIVTLGGKGCSFNGSIIKSERSSRKSTVGAGDAFRAGLYASLYRGMGMEKACRCANRVALEYIENDRSLNLLDWTRLCGDNDAE